MNPLGLLLVATATAIAFTVVMVLLWHWLFRPFAAEYIPVEVEP